MVVRKVNMHFVHQHRKKMWSFITLYEGNAKHYYVDIGKSRKEVDKETGNKIYKRMRRCFPQAKTLIIVDNDKGSKVSYTYVMDHYEVLVDGKFVESCDLAELNGTIKKYEEMLKTC